jgi:hypothetical protein
MTVYKAIIVKSINIYNCTVNKASNLTCFEPLPQAKGRGGSLVVLGYSIKETYLFRKMYMQKYRIIMY